MNQWKCVHCGWTGTNPDWDRHEHRRLCPECDDPVEREVSDDGDESQTHVEQPKEDAHGNRIEYVYVVCRPAANSDLGRCEILGVWKDEERAEEHRKHASTMGECKIKERDLKPHGDWNVE